MKCTLKPFTLYFYFNKNSFCYFAVAEWIEAASFVLKIRWFFWIYTTLMAKSLWCEQQPQCWPLYSQSFVLTVASWLVELCREREEAARNFSVFRTFHNLFGWNKQIFVTKHIFSPSQVRKGKVETIPQKKKGKKKSSLLVSTCAVLMPSTYTEQCALKVCPLSTGWD